MKRLPIFTATLLVSALVGWWFSQPALILLMADETGGPEAGTESLEGERKVPANVAGEAEQLLQTARERLFRRRSVTAKLQEIVSIGDYRFRATGTYAAGNFPKLRLDFQVKVGNTTGTLLEVCDGQLLWTVQEIQSGEGEEPHVRVSRTVIDHLERAYQDSKDDPKTMLIGSLGVGGLPSLLAALERSMTFDALKVTEHEGQRYTVIQGHWNDEYLARFGGGSGRPLPEYVPDRVRVYFHEETLFPTRILYLKDSPGKSKLPYQLLLSLEFSDIELDGVVSEAQFRYVPPNGIQVENRTSEFLDLINKAKEQVPADGGLP